MSRPNPRKIATDATPGGTLFQPFAGLNLGALPEPEAPADNPVPPQPCKKGRVILRRETARRGGKSVIVIDGFEAQHGEEALEILARWIRSAIGTGGSVQGRTIEIQGDAVGRIREILTHEGFLVGGIQ
jgi:translation initiation factor 1